VTRASIIIPVHNGAALTRRCLHSLLEDTLGVEAEVIVVDDASTDGTQRLLAQVASRSGMVQTVRQPVNSGFANACNRGAALAKGDFLVFLNNDTLPLPGWLDALVHYADAHPRAAAVGARLLYPDGTVQHAGVVFGEDHNPHHVYAGLPGDHPAVLRPRRFQAVTAACMLVRHSTFDSLGGFDPAFRNGHEDVDLCLRLGDCGEEVHYCPDSVVLHLESVSRGRRTAEAAANGKLYRDRWAAHIRPDDLRTYVEDGLIRLSYGDRHPLRLEVSPLLATVHGGERQPATERLLRDRSQQVADLLQQVVELTVHAAGLEDPLTAPLRAAGGRIAPTDDLGVDEETLEALAHLQQVLSARYGAFPAVDTAALAYRRLVARVRGTVAGVTREGSIISVVSRGDDALVEFDGRTGFHFPRTETGAWAGHHPAGSDEALAELAAHIRLGSSYLVIPSPSSWWLDQYRDFAHHLRQAHSQIEASEHCLVFSLSPVRQAVNR
jgi:GT2 family glycosyltransferase